MINRPEGWGSRFYSGSLLIMYMDTTGRDDLGDQPRRLVGISRFAK